MSSPLPSSHRALEQRYSNVILLLSRRNNVQKTPSGQYRRKSSLCIFDMTKKRTPSDCFFGDFAHSHWAAFERLVPAV